MANKDLICEIGDCEKKVHARGMCMMHLRRAYRAKIIDITPKQGYSVKYKTEWILWCGIKSRCYCKTNTNYDSYGAKGIKMSEEWRSSFMAFFRDMGPRPEGEFDVDRKDSNGNYCKENCRWHPRELNVKGTAKEYARKDDLPF